MAAERTVEQPQPEFDPQDSPHGPIDKRCGQAFFTDGLFEGRQVEVRRHLHIHAGSQRLDGRLGAVGRYAVLLQFGHGVPVAEHEAVESPLFSENPVQRQRIGRGRRAGDIVEGRHDTYRTGIDTCLERRQIGFAQSALRQLGKLIVPAAQCGAVADEMLDTGPDPALLRGIVALIAADESRTENGIEQHVLPRTFGDTPPARIACDVHHRTEREVDAAGRRFRRRDPGRRFGKLRIPRRRNAQRNGEEGAVTVDDIESEKNGDSEPASLHGNTLQPVALRRGERRTVSHDQRPDLAAGYACVERRVVRPVERLGELSQLFTEGHPREQVVHPFGERCGGVPVKRLLGRTGQQKTAGSHGQEKGFHDRRSFRVRKDSNFRSERASGIREKCRFVSGAA